MHIYLSLFPRLWGQRERNPPSYDSRVHGLTRLLGTSPPRSSPLPHTAPPPVCLPLSLSSLVFFLFFLCLRAGPPWTDPKWSRHASFPWLMEWSQPWLPSRPGLAAQYESEAPCWWTGVITISLSSTSKNGDPNSRLFSRPRLTVDEREHGLPLGDHLYLASFIIIFAASPGMLAMIHICDPSALPSFQMGDGSVVILFVLIVLFVLSLEYLGVRRPV